MNPYTNLRAAGVDPDRFGALASETITRTRRIVDRLLPYPLRLTESAFGGLPMLAFFERKDARGALYNRVLPRIRAKIEQREIAHTFAASVDRRAA